MPSLNPGNCLYSHLKAMVTVLSVFSNCSVVVHHQATVSQHTTHVYIKLLMKLNLSVLRL